nr:immunoglobulin light chain junction region [Macaca mulatta]
LRAGTHLPYSF